MLCCYEEHVFKKKLTLLIHVECFFDTFVLTVYRSVKLLL